MIFPNSKSWLVAMTLCNDEHVYALNQGQRGLSLKSLRIAKMKNLNFLAPAQRNWMQPILPHTKHRLGAICKTKPLVKWGDSGHLKRLKTIFFKFGFTCVIDSGIFSGYLLNISESFSNSDLKCKGRNINKSVRPRGPPHRCPRFWTAKPRPNFDISDHI